MFITQHYLSSEYNNLIYRKSEKINRPINYDLFMSDQYLQDWEWKLNNIRHYLQPHKTVNVEKTDEKESLDIMRWLKEHGD